VKIWKFVWWSANRDKICQVVRKSEKVENRCSKASMRDCGLFRIIFD